MAVASGASHISASSFSGAITYWRKRALDIALAMMLLSAGIVGTATGVWLFTVLRAVDQLDLMIGLSYVTLLTVVGAAAITYSAGLSLALGAFLAGLLVGETEFKHQTEVDLEPFKGLLLGLFFMTVGMSLNLPDIAGNILWIMAALIALVVVKVAIAYAACRFSSSS